MGMKSMFCSVLLLGLFGCGSCCGERISLAPGCVEVLVGENVPQSTRDAAREMRTILGEAFGVEVPQVTAPTAGKTTIFLGDNEWNRAAGIDSKAFARDEFRIVIGKGAVRIAGHDAEPDGCTYGNVERATQFGVYEFLERYAGCRFYFPGELGTIVPKTARIELKPADFRVKPHFVARNYRCGNGAVSPELIPDGGTAEAFELLNLQRLRMQTVAIPANHGQLNSCFYRRFHKSHPEYFIMTEDGKRKVDEEPEGRFCGNEQMCHSSGIWDEIYKDAKSYLTGEPPEKRGLYWRNHFEHGYLWGRQASARKYYDVSPQDGIRECFCEKCQPKYDKSKFSYMSDFLWGNVSRLGNRLKAEGVPGFITFEAYSRMIDVPKCDLPDNVVVQVTVPGPWTPTKNADGSSPDDIVHAWSKKVGRNITVWGYAFKEDGMGPGAGHHRRSPDVPQMTPHAWGNLWKRLAPYCCGGFNESESDVWIFNYLNFYVFSRVAWNPDVDLDAVLDEHYRLMFGAAAQPMKSFYEGLERKWNGEFIDRTFDMDEMGPLSGRASWYRLWNEIYDEKTIDGFDALLRQAAAAVAPGSIESKRVAFFRRVFFEKMADHSRVERERMSVAYGEKRRAASKSPNLVPADQCDFVLERQGREDTRGHQRQIRSVPCVAGKRYRVSFFAKLDDVKAPERCGGFEVKYHDGTKWTYFTDTDPILFGTTKRFYREYEIAAPACPNGRLEVLLEIATWNPHAGKVTVDGFRIEELQEF